jgi:hypothetical protein
MRKPRAFSSGEVCTAISAAREATDNDSRDFPVTSEIDHEIYGAEAQTSPEAMHLDNEIGFSSMQHFRTIAGNELGRVRFSTESKLRTWYCSQDNMETDHTIDNNYADSDQKVMFEITTATKTADGPSPATLVTQKLFFVVKKDKRINRQQVIELLNSAGDLSSESHDSPSAAKTKPDASFISSPSRQADTLSDEVLSRLESLAARIDAKGTASLLPCSTNLGRQYLPIIRFLVSCIPDGASTDAAVIMTQRF